MERMFEWGLQAAFFLFITAAAWQDARSGSISRTVFVIFGLTGAALKGGSIMTGVFMGKEEFLQDSVIAAGKIMAETADLAAAMGIGAFLFVLSDVTGEAIGKGDGWFFLISGVYLGFWKNLLLLTGGLFLCFPVGMVLFMKQRWSGEKRERTRLPFLPFVLPVGIGVMLL